MPLFDSKPRAPLAGRLPRLAIRVGFVGKRDLEPEAEPGLRRYISEILQLIQCRMEELLQSVQLSDIYSSDAPRLMLVSSLAKGADMVASEVALEQKWALHVILPFPGEQFRRAGFNSEAELAKFDALLVMASNEPNSCFVMDLPRGEDHEAMNQAYAAAGTMTVEYSDILLAIWDGWEARGPGGTAESIRKAKAAGVPVVLIPADGASPPRLIHPENKELDYLREVIADIVAMPDHELEVGGRGRDPRERFLRYVHERVPRCDLGWVFRLAREFFLIGLQRKSAPYSGRWPKEPRCCWPLPVQEYFEPSENWADRLALHYAGWTRGTFTVNCLLSGVAVTAAVAERLWPGISLLDFFGICGTMASLLAILLYLVARGRDVHTRWIEYRILAELLYSCGMLMAIGASPRLHSRFQKDHREFSGWVKWYVDALVRSLGVLRIELDKHQLDMYRNLIMDRLDRQVTAYHVPRYKENGFIAARIKTVGTILFIIVVLSSLTGLATRALNFNQYSWFHSGWGVAVNQITSVAVLCTISGATLAVFAYQAEFSKLAQISKIVEQQLRKLYSIIDGSSSSGENLRTLTMETVQLLLQEHEDWYLFYSLREVEKPI